MAHVPSERNFGEVQHLSSFHKCLPAIADRYTALCGAGDKAARTADSDPFCAPARHPPAMSGHDFVVRLCKYAHSSPQVFVVAIIFMERYLDRTATPVTSRNFHRTATPVTSRNFHR
eukprot:Hpha_TRINITY_DN12056_c0_g1::TRINITY_DN12056_c0_g1_i2::g.140976::m.140976